MNIKLKKISTVNMSREDWLEHRKNSIGGSDASAILGLNNFSTPYTVWADKMGMSEDKPDNEAMRLGRDMEEYVAKRFTEATEKKVRRCNNIIINPDLPFMHANVDRLIVGEDAGLECKTTSAFNLKRFKGGEYPASYYGQCMHYMAVTGCARWYLAVLVLGQGFYHFCIERDEEEIQALIELEKTFWGMVERKEVPPVDGLHPTGEAIKANYPNSNGEEIALFGRDDEMKRYLLLQNSIKEVQKKMDEIKQCIQLDLGECEKGVGDLYVALWKNQVRNTFDHKRFALEHPEIDISPYYKQSNSRVFSIKEVK